MLGSRPWGVLNGLQVTENSTPDMSVLVTAGSCIVNGSEITKSSSTNVALDAADPNNPRWDIITINDAGTIAATAGTPAANPVPPDIPANNILLALVYVGAGVTAIYNSNIYDRRVFIEKIKDVHVDSISLSKITGHDKAAHDALNIDADTVDGYHAGDFEKTANKGVADGYCPLDSNALVPLSNIPSTLTGKDADLWDGKHRTDNQTLGGNVTIGGTLTTNDNITITKNRGAIYMRYDVNLRWMMQAGEGDNGAFRWKYSIDGGSTYALKMYLAGSSGNLYIDGTYNTFSPYVPDSEAELLRIIKTEVTKPSPRREKGTLIGDDGRRIEQLTESELETFSEKYAKDIGKISIACGKLLLIHAEKIAALEEELRRLQSEKT